MGSGIREVLGRLDRELWLVTAQAGGRRGGLIATFVGEASIAPEAPRMVVGIGRAHHTWELIEGSGAFALHLLGEEHLDWVWRFGLESGRGRDKLAGLSAKAGITGSPIVEGALGFLECRVEERMDTGDRTIWLAEVLDGRLLGDAAPLTTKRLFGLAPPDKLEALGRLYAEDGARDLEAIRAWRARRQGAGRPPEAGTRPDAVRE